MSIPFYFAPPAHQDRGHLLPHPQFLSIWDYFTAFPPGFLQSAKQARKCSAFPQINSYSSIFFLLLDNMKRCEVNKGCLRLLISL